MKNFNAIFVLILSILLHSCKTNNELPNNITVKGKNKYISTEDNIVVYSTLDYLEDNRSDSINVYLSKEDWGILNKSFIKNKLFLFRGINDDIGIKTNSIEIPEKYIIKTNSRNIIINYRYYFDGSEINKEKTERFKSFIKVFDSIIYYKIHETKKR